jgi:hypothetical protein
MAPQWRLNRALIELYWDTKHTLGDKKNRIVTFGEGGKRVRKQKNINACFYLFTESFIEPYSLNSASCRLVQP